MDGVPLDFGSTNHACHEMAWNGTAWHASEISFDFPVPSRGPNSRSMAIFPNVVKTHEILYLSGNLADKKAKLRGPRRAHSSEICIQQFGEARRLGNYPRLDSNSRGNGATHRSGRNYLGTGVRRYAIASRAKLSGLLNSVLVSPVLGKTGEPSGSVKGRISVDAPDPVPVLAP